MQIHRIPYAATGRFAPVVIDHLNNEPFVREFLPKPPDLNGVLEAARERQFAIGDRLTLCDALDRQHHGLELHEAVEQNLKRLRAGDALTITTGHQLCLFTGPLYVPFKILNTIRLAKVAEERLQRPVIPVFWMATEDHDLAEVDHAFVHDRKVHWKTSARGAVGRMLLTDIEVPLQEAITAMGTGAFADEMADLLRDCYRPERTLAEATRRFVLALFGRFGLITVDGDDPALKRLFIPVMREEVLNQVTQRTVAYANERIAARYTVQAHAREINLFHLRPGHRSRIVLEGDHYVVLDGGPRWTVDQLLQELEHRSEDFSPNVLLRPIYQETVLPNIAYIGGGGELAYWMQLRWLFQGLQVSMPVVMLRTSAGSIPEKRLRHWLGSGAGISGLFAPLDAMKAQVAVQQVPYSTDVEKEIERLNATYTELSVRAAAADATLKNAVEARRVQAIRGLERIQKGLIRAAKHDQHVLMQRMDAAHAALFPGGGLQERKANMLPTLVAKGPQVLDEWLEVLDPLDPQFTLFVD